MKASLWGLASEGLGIAFTGCPILGWVILMPIVQTAFWLSQAWEANYWLRFEELAWSAKGGGRMKTKEMREIRKVHFGLQAIRSVKQKPIEASPFSQAKARLPFFPPFFSGTSLFINDHCVPGTVLDPRDTKQGPIFMTFTI